MNSPTINTRFFRAGVGTVIYNEQHQVAIFKRAKYPVGVWQFQQGGIDLGEETETTLWRELHEEIGLTKDDIAEITEMPEWTVYPTADALAEASKSRIGQAHKWYFLKLRPNTTIDLSLATDQEASDYKFVSFAEAIAETEPLKQPVYHTLKRYFEKYIAD
jgi:putative (di)nucleoside polyphosphate hydrolase